MYALHHSAPEADVQEARSRSAREGGDYCSQAGALALKSAIESYWRARGHEVMVALAPFGFDPAMRAARFDLRSDLVNGLPRARTR